MYQHDKGSIKYRFSTINKQSWPTIERSSYHASVKLHIGLNYRSIYINQHAAIGQRRELQQVKVSRAAKQRSRRRCYIRSVRRGEIGRRVPKSQFYWGNLCWKNLQTPFPLYICVTLMTLTINHSESTCIY